MNSDPQTQQVSKPPTKGELGFYRRFFGNLSILNGIIVSVLSGFDWFNPDSSAIWASFTAGFVLLGVGNVTDIYKIKR